jgi:hypothetical protein
MSKHRLTMVVVVVGRSPKNKKTYTRMLILKERKIYYRARIYKLINKEIKKTEEGR